MTNKRSELDDLEMFHDGQQEPPAEHDGLHEPPGDRTEDYAEESDYDGGGTAEDEDGTRPASHDDFEDLQSLTDELLTTDETRSRTERRPQSRRRRNRADPEPSDGGQALIAVGCVVMFTGFTLALLRVLSPVLGARLTANLISVGLTPGLLVALGALLTTAALLLRGQRAADRQITAMRDRIAELDENATNNLDYLVDAHEEHLDRRPASGEELDQVLHSLARQDEKINNLTRALKMYGKPLVEVSKQVADVAARTQSVAAKLATFTEQQESTWTQIQPLLDGLAQRLTGELVEMLSELPKGSDTEASFRKLKDELADAQRAMQEALHEAISGVLEGLPKGTDTDAILGAVKDELANAQRAMHEALHKEIGGILEGLPKGADTESILSALKEEFTAAKRSIQDSVRKSISGITLAAPTVASGSDVAPRRAAPPTDDAEPDHPREAKPTSAAPSAKGPGGPGPGGLAHSIAGTERKNGKSVMGAIAKLKRMRPS